MIEHANPSPEDYLMTDPGEEPPHASSLSGLVGEALETGVSDASLEDEDSGDARLAAGDADADLEENATSGDELPGGDMPLPDQNNVDEIGRAYGVSEEGSGALVSGQALMDQRDEHRWELDPRSRDQGT